MSLEVFIALFLIPKTDCHPARETSEAERMALVPHSSVSRVLPAISYPVKSCIHEELHNPGLQDHALRQLNIALPRL